MLDYAKKIKNYTIIIGFLLLFLCLLLVSVTPPVNAAEITARVNNNTIYWAWDYTTITNITVDGVDIENYHANLTYYTKTFEDDYPTSHTLGLYEGNIFINGSNTTTVGKTDYVKDFFTQYVYLIIVIVLLITCVIIKREEMAFAAFFVALIGLSQVGADSLGQIIYGLSIIASLYVTFRE